MSKLQWRVATLDELSTLLTQARVEKSAAIGTSTIYQVVHEGQETIAVALPDGQAVIIELAKLLNTKRRRLDPLKNVADQSL
jgi:hypothetical protein